MQTQCLVVGEKPTVEVKVRFLHVVERRSAGKPARTRGEGLEFVDELRVGGNATSRGRRPPREVVVSGLGLAALETPMRATISVPAGTEEEPLATTAEK